MDPFRPADDAARDLARRLLAGMSHATLAVIAPDGGFPHVARIACQHHEGQGPVALLSDLAQHSRALRTDPRAGLLIDPMPLPDKGDPLTWPRLSLRVSARPRDRTPDLRDRWLAAHPRAAIFVDLPDFHFWELAVQDALLNAGFGAAYRLTAADLDPSPTG